MPLHYNQYPLKSNPLGYFPVNERQARPLTKLEPEQQQEAWKTVVETAPEGKRGNRLHPTS